MGTNPLRNASLELGASLALAARVPGRIVFKYGLVCALLIGALPLPRARAQPPPVSFTASNADFSYWNSIRGDFQGRIENNGDALRIIVSSCVISNNPTKYYGHAPAEIGGISAAIWDQKLSSENHTIPLTVQPGEKLAIEPFELTIRLDGFALRAEDSIAFHIQLGRGFLPVHVFVHLPGAPPFPPGLGLEWAWQTETELQWRPDNVGLRSELIHKYFRLASQGPDAERARVAQVYWMVSNQPEADVMEDPAFAVSQPGKDYDELARAWLVEVDLHATTAQVLANAAYFFSALEPQRSLELLARAQALETPEK